MMNFAREKELKAAAQRLKYACKLFHDSKWDCRECPAYIEWNKMAGEKRCYFSGTWTKPCEWEL